MNIEFINQPDPLPFEGAKVTLTAAQVAALYQLGNYSLSTIRGTWAADAIADIASEVYDAAHNAYPSAFPLGALIGKAYGPVSAD